MTRSPLFWAVSRQPAAFHARTCAAPGRIVGGTAQPGMSDAVNKSRKTSEKSIEYSMGMRPGSGGNGVRAFRRVKFYWSLHTFIPRICLSHPARVPVYFQGPVTWHRASITGLAPVSCCSVRRRLRGGALSAPLMLAGALFARCADPTRQNGGSCTNPGRQGKTQWGLLSPPPPQSSLGPRRGRSSPRGSGWDKVMRQRDDETTG